MANDLSAQLQAKFNASAPDKEPERDTLGQLIALIRKVTGTEEDLDRETRLTVSYTHLTLPTICSV